MVMAATPALAATSPDGNIEGVAGALVLLGLIVAAYFFPALIAWRRGHPNTLAIFLLNLLAGWTFIGWVGALVWAATAVARPSDDRIRIRREDR